MKQVALLPIGSKLNRDAAFSSRALRLLLLWRPMKMKQVALLREVAAASSDSSEGGRIAIPPTQSAIPPSQSCGSKTGSIFCDGSFGSDGSAYPW